MSRRGGSVTFRCVAEGCGESTFSEYATLKERAETVAWYTRRPYRCFRHLRPSDVLSAENIETVGVLVAVRVKASRLARSIYDKSDEDRYLSGLYWSEDGVTGSGITSGPGFRAIASDLPEGTRLVVTARLEFPEAGDAS